MPTSPHTARKVYMTATQLTSMQLGATGLEATRLRLTGQDLAEIERSA